MLKDYMQTGKFSRGDQEFSASCSIVLGGNIDTDMDQRQPDARYRHLFEPLPPELRDAAFLDRITRISPGRKCPRFAPTTTPRATVSGRIPTPSSLPNSGAAISKRT